MAENFFVRPRLNPSARIRLFCCHSAGGGASQFVPWAHLLSPKIEVCIIQLPGRENRIREKPYHRIEPLLSDLEDSIYPLLDRPYAIFGMSLGGTVGFELARRLRGAYSILPEHLFIASRRAPQIPDRFSPIAQLDEAPFIDHIQDRYNGIPELIRNDKELLDLFLPVLRADFQLLESYRYHPEPALDCPISAFRGLNDTIVEEEDTQAWKQHTSKQFSHQSLPGGHFFFNDNHTPIVRELNERLLGKSL